MFERMSGSQVVIGPNALIQILSPDGDLVVELKVSTFLLRKSVGLVLYADKLAQAAREAKSFRRVQPRDPTTGRFMSAEVDGVEDGEPSIPATERVRAADPTRRSVDGSWLTFVHTDEVSDEMIVGDEDFAPSPEDILLAREEEDEFKSDDDEDGDDDMPDRFELMALAAEAEVASRGFSSRQSFLRDDFDDFLGCAEDFEDVDESSDDDEPAEEVEFSSVNSDDGDSHVDDADAFYDRSVVLRKDKCGRRLSFSRPNTPERRRRAELISRMRRARRSAQSWLTKPDWSDKAVDLLDTEVVV